jgi:hypothetical protein
MKPYTKTIWVDNETPVNAANLNKIENAIRNITDTAISPSDLIEGEGIEINTSCGKIEIKNTHKPSEVIVCDSDEYRALEIVEKDKIYMVIDPLNPKSIRFVYNSNDYYPQTLSSKIVMDSEKSESLDERLDRDYNTLVDKINELSLRLKKLEDGTQTM